MIKKFILLATITCSLFATSCTNDLAEQYQGDKPVDKGSKGVYILSSGKWQAGNASLAYYDFQQGKFASFKDGNNLDNYDYFFMNNKRKLGDNANDMQLYGSKIYLAVSESGTIEVLDMNTGKSLKQIEMKNESGVNRKPRRITFYKENAYVCCFDGSVAKIDTTSLTVKGYIPVGVNPDAICCTNNKIYVSNSGGYSFDETVSVIDPTTFTEIKKIKVRQNPGNLGVDDKGNLFVVSRAKFDKVTGDYDYRLHLIDTKTDEVTKEYNYKAYNFVISGHKLYMYSYKDKVVQVMDTYTGDLINKNFITDGTTLTAPYSLCVSPNSGDLYISDALDYSANGQVFCFDQNGKHKYTMNAGGVIPSALLFK